MTYIKQYIVCVFCLFVLAGCHPTGWVPERDRIHLSQDTFYLSPAEQVITVSSDKRFDIDAVYLDDECIIIHYSDIDPYTHLTLYDPIEAGWLTIDYDENNLTMSILVRKNDDAKERHAKISMWLCDTGASIYITQSGEGLNVI